MVARQPTGQDGRLGHGIAALRISRKDRPAPSPGVHQPADDQDPVDEPRSPAGGDRASARLVALLLVLLRLDGRLSLCPLPGCGGLGSSCRFGGRDPRPGELASTGDCLGAAQGAARVGARPGVQKVRRHGAGGRSHTPLFAHAGIRRRNFVLAIPFQVASHRNGGGRHVRRTVRGAHRRDSIGLIHCPALGITWR